MSSYASWEFSQPHSRLWLEHRELGERIAVRSGQVIFEEQTRHAFFYLIRAGYVQATIARGNGKPLLLEIYGPGTIFGEGAAFEQGPRLVTATAVSDCALNRYDAGALEAEFARTPQLAVSLIRLMSAKQRALANKVAGLSATAPEVRLCDLLLRVGRAEQAQRPQAARLQVHLTHEQLAAMAGLSRVTVTRTLAKLAREGLVRTLAGAVDILDAPRLQERLRQG